MNIMDISEKNFEATIEQVLLSVKVNVEENARLTFDHVANDKIQEMIDSNFKFYKQVTDDPAFGRFLLDWLFDRYKRREKGAA
jgi:type I restriction enzyme, R subunit